MVARRRPAAGPRPRRPALAAPRPAAPLSRRQQRSGALLRRRRRLLARPAGPGTPWPLHAPARRLAALAGSLLNANPSPLPTAGTVTKSHDTPWKHRCSCGGPRGSAAAAARRPRRRRMPEHGRRRLHLQPCKRPGRLLRRQDVPPCAQAVLPHDEDAGAALPWCAWPWDTLLRAAGSSCLGSFRLPCANRRATSWPFRTHPFPPFLP